MALCAPVQGQVAEQRKPVCPPPAAPRPAHRGAGRARVPLRPPPRRAALSHGRWKFRRVQTRGAGRGRGNPWSEPVTCGGVAPGGPAPSPSPSLSGRGYMAATAAKRESRRRRCRQHSRRPEPTLGAVREPRTPSMSRRSPVSVCVYVCGRAGGAAWEGAAAGPAAAEPAPSSIVCDPPAAAAQQRRFCSISRPPPARLPALPLGPGRRVPARAGGPGSPRGAGGAAAAPLPPGTPLAGSRQPVPAAPAGPGGPLGGCGTSACAWLCGFEARPGRRARGGGREGRPGSGCPGA